MSIGRLGAGDTAIQPTIFDAKADLLTATAADTPARLAVGANNTVLTADSAEATGLKWATPAGGGMTSIASGNFNTGAATLDLTSIPTTYQQLVLFLKDVATGSAGTVQLRFNNDSSGLYSSTSSAAFLANAATSTLIAISPSLIANAVDGLSVITLNNYANSTAFKIAKSEFFGQSGSGPDQFTISNAIGAYRSTTAITQLNIFNSAAANWSAGTYELFGVK